MDPHHLVQGFHVQLRSVSLWVSWLAQRQQEEVLIQCYQWSHYDSTCYFAPATAVHLVLLVLRVKRMPKKELMAS